MSRVAKFRRQPHTRGRGQVAEMQAVAWLKTQGYRIEERNVRNRGGEIDVVAWDRETLCFIEVRARTNPSFGAAIATVTPAKQRRLVRSASLYLARRGLEDVACRFDVLGLDQVDEASSRFRYTLIKHAFTADGHLP